MHFLPTPSFIQDISVAPLQVHLLLRIALDYSRGTVSEFDAESLQTTTSDGLAKVPAWRPEWDSNPQPCGRKAPNTHNIFSTRPIVTSNV